MHCKRHLGWSTQSAWAKRLDSNFQKMIVGDTSYIKKLKKILDFTTFKKISFQSLTEEMSRNFLIDLPLQHLLGMFVRTSGNYQTYFTSDSTF